MRVLITMLCLTIAVLLGSVRDSSALSKYREYPSFHAECACLLKAQETPSKEADPDKMLEDGMRMILSAIELFLKSIPEYNAPEILENGDIIIRRVQPTKKLPDRSNEGKEGI